MAAQASVTVTRPVAVSTANSSTALASSALSRVGGAAGRFRAEPGELRAAFAELELIAAGEGRGHAWLLGRRKPG